MFKFNWYNKFGTIPSSYREAMSYEEQILWLCQQVEDLKSTTGNYNYNLLINKPSINGVTLEGNIPASSLGLDNYNSLLNKPSINGYVLMGNRTLSELGIQEKLIAGSGIRIVGNTISSTGGGSGGTSDYRDLEYKPSINGVTLEGDKTAKELNLQKILKVDRTNDISINSGKVADIGAMQVDDVIPQKLPIADELNGSYVVYKVAEGDRFDISGNFDLYKTDSLNRLKLIYTTNNEYDESYFEASNDGNLIINFFDLSSYTPYLAEFYSGEQLNLNFEATNKNLEFNKTNVDNFLNLNFPYENLLTSIQNGIFNNIQVGATLNAPDTDLDTNKYVKISTASKMNSIFKIKGQALNNVIWFTTKRSTGILEEPVETILSCSEMNLIVDGTISIDIPDEADYLYFQFTDYDVTNRLQAMFLYPFNNVSVVDIPNSIILLPDTEAPLDSGFLLINNGIYIGSASPSNLVYGAGEIVYFSATDNTFYGSLKSVSLEQGTWTILDNSEIENSLTNSRAKIPTSYAVTEAIANAGLSFYTSLSETLIFNLDGTNNLNLSDGYYLTSSVEYYDNDGLHVATDLSNEFCYYNSTTKIFSITGLQKNLRLYTAGLVFYDSTHGWIFSKKEFSNVLTKSDIVTSISSASTDDKVPSAKAVYDNTEYSYIRCETSSAETITPSGTGTVNSVFFNLDSQNNYGNCFELLNNGHIKVLRNITSATIYGRINPYNMGTGTAKTVGCAVRLLRNSSWSNIVSSEFRTTEGIGDFVETDIIPLQENDEIAIGFFTQTLGATGISKAYLSISTNKI